MRAAKTMPLIHLLSLARSALLVSLSAIRPLLLLHLRRAAILLSLRAALRLVYCVAALLTHVIWRRAKPLTSPRAQVACACIIAPLLF